MFLIQQVGDLDSRSGGQHSQFSFVTTFLRCVAQHRHGDFFFGGCHRSSSTQAVRAESVMTLCPFALFVAVSSVEAGDDPFKVSAALDTVALRGIFCHGRFLLWGMLCFCRVFIDELHFRFAYFTSIPVLSMGDMGYSRIFWDSHEPSSCDGGQLVFVFLLCLFHAMGNLFYSIQL